MKDMKNLFKKAEYVLIAVKASVDMKWKNNLT